MAGGGQAYWPGPGEHGSDIGKDLSDPKFSYSEDDLVRELKIDPTGGSILPDMPSSQWFKINSPTKDKKGGKVKAKTSKYSKGGGVRKSKYSL